MMLIHLHIMDYNLCANFKVILYIIVVSGPLYPDYLKEIQRAWEIHVVGNLVHPLLVVWVFKILIARHELLILFSLVEFST